MSSYSRSNAPTVDDVDLASSGAEIAEFMSLVSRVFSGLKASPALAKRVREGAADVLRTLVRRARRRRADFDLCLREADAAYAEDMALVVKVQQGNAKAYEALDARLQRVIMRRLYAFRLEWNREELFPLVFARVTDKLATYRGQASLQTWAGRIAENTIKNWIRAESRRPDVGPIGEGPDEPVDEAPNPEGVLIVSERDEQIGNFAAELARVGEEVLQPEDWTLLRQLIVDEESYEVISAATGKRSGTLRKRRFDVVRKLRAAVLERHGDQWLVALRETLEPVVP